MRAAAVGTAASAVDVDTFPNACGRGKIQMRALRPLLRPHPAADRAEQQRRAPTGRRTAVDSRPCDCAIRPRRAAAGTALRQLCLNRTAQRLGRWTTTSLPTL